MPQSPRVGECMVIKLIENHVAIDFLMMDWIGPLRYDTVGKIAVALERYSYFGDDILQISTLKGKECKRALDPHKLEALHSFCTTYTFIAA